MDAYMSFDSDHRRDRRPACFDTQARRRERGFTLIELMITVAIVAILAGIAIPAYTSYIQSSRARTAGGDLVTLAAALENIFQRTLAYPAGSTAATAATVALVNDTWFPAEGDDFVYSTATTASTYALVATGNGCTLTLNQANQRTVAGARCGGLSGW